MAWLLRIYRMFGQQMRNKLVGKPHMHEAVLQVTLALFFHFLHMKNNKKIRANVTMAAMSRTSTTGTPTAAGLMAAPPGGGGTTVGVGDVVAMEVEGDEVDDIMMEDEGMMGIGRSPSMNSVK